MNLTYKQVTAETMPIAVAIHHQIWPNTTVDEDYLGKPLDPNDRSNVSWLVYHGDDLVGLTGVYAYDPDEPGYDDGESIWMDWFAILPEFRRQHFGSQVVQDVIEYCRALKQYKYFRIDTTYFPGRPAVSLYDKIMTTREEYTAEDTPDSKLHFLIYSYSLDGSPIKPWNNHLLNLRNDNEGGKVN